MIVRSDSLLVRMISADSLLLGVELRAEEEPAHADDRVHRRPDLVAHRGEERALRLRRRFRLLTSTLQLAHVSRLLDRRRGERGKGRCHARVLGGVEVCLEAVDRQHPDQAVPDQQRHAHECPDTPAAVGFLLEVLEPRGDVRDDDRLARLDHLAGRIVGPPPVEAQSEQLVEVRKAEAADDHHLVAVELLDGGGSIRHDLPQLRQDQIEDLGQVQRLLESDWAAARSVSACSRAARSVSSKRAFSIAIAAWAAKAVARSASSSS